MHITIQTLARHYAARSRKLRRSRTVRLRPSKPSRAAELWYKAELLKVVRYITAETEREILPLLKSTMPFLGDAAPPDLIHKVNLLARRFGKIEKTAKRLSRQAVMRNLQATDSQFIEHIQKAIGVDIRPWMTADGIREPLRAAEQANIELIQSIPEQYFDKLRKTLDQNYEVGGRWESLAEDIRHVGEVTESRAKLIARDQTSKMNSALSRSRLTSIGINKYKWQTAGDERVRPTHRENDGKTFTFNNPPSETGNPGDDVNCRCVAIPEFDLDDDE